MSDSKPGVRPLVTEQNAWKDSGGRHLVLCAICSMDPSVTQVRQSVTVVGGFAVCGPHLGALANHIEAGASVGNVIRYARTSRF